MSYCDSNGSTAVTVTVPTIPLSVHGLSSNAHRQTGTFKAALVGIVRSVINARLVSRFEILPICRWKRRLINSLHIGLCIDEKRMIHPFLTRQDGWMRSASVSGFRRSGNSDLVGLNRGCAKPMTCRFLARCSGLLGKTKCGWLSVNIVWLRSGHIIRSWCWRSCLPMGQHYKVAMSAHGHKSVPVLMLLGCKTTTQQTKFIRSLSGFLSIYPFLKEQNNRSRSLCSSCSTSGRISPKRRERWF